MDRSSALGLRGSWDGRCLRCFDGPVVSSRVGWGGGRSLFSAPAPFAPGESGGRVPDERSLFVGAPQRNRGEAMSAEKRGAQSSQLLVTRLQVAEGGFASALQ